MNMPKNNRKETANGITPLISFDEVTAERESFKLSWTVLANIREYVSYVRDVTGKETSSDEVVDKALQRLFDADKGFRHWLHKKNGVARNRVKTGRTEKGERPNLDGRASVSVKTLPKLHI
jgi:hypothetical protein